MSGQDRVATIRRLSGLTQQELARRSGIQRTTITMYENGRREPSVSALERLSRAANCTITITADAEDAGRRLEEVLELAESLPHDRHDPLPTPIWKPTRRPIQ